MTCNITATPLDIEPLPLYRRDPETSSLLSSAPSYTSEAPTYRSSARDSQTTVSEPAQQCRQPQPYYVATSLLDISAPPPTRSNHTTAATDPPASTNPQYNSNNNSNVQRPLLPRPGGGSGLPSPTFAQGFILRAPNAAASDTDALQSGYNIGTWSSVTASSHLQRRQYERVAMRRASRAAGIDRATALLESMKLSNSEDPPSPVGGESRAETPQPPPSSSSTTEVQAGDGDRCGGGSGRGDAVEASTERSTASAPDVGSVASDTTAASSTSSPSVSEPVLPLEDPALVGEEAAKRARQQRLYREACLKHDGDMRLVQENKSWDFMLSQMADWEERERSWSKFRSEIEMRQGRIRAMGVGIGRLGGFGIGDGSRSRGKKWSLGKGRTGSR